MAYDHLGFVEAIEDLAARAGLDVPREGGDTASRPTRGALCRARARGALLPAVADDCRATRATTWRSAASTAETIAKFGIGYAPARWDAVLVSATATTTPIGRTCCGPA